LTFSRHTRPAAEQFDSARLGNLTGVHIRVCALDYFGCVVIGAKHGDTRRRVSAQRFVRERNLQRGNHCFVLVRLCTNVSFGCIPQKQDKFISAETTDHVRSARMAVEKRRNGFQDCIPGQMPMAIVDCFEIIQIDEDESSCCSIPLHMCEGSIELSFKTSAVEDIEERISFDLIFQMTNPLARSVKLGIEFLEPIQDQRHRNVFHRTARDFYRDPC